MRQFALALIVSLVMLSFVVAPLSPCGAHRRSSFFW